MPVRRQLLGLAGWLALTAAAASIGAAATWDAAGFYQQLARPAWAPPGWLFGPVWTLLYLLMALAVWLVWRAVPWRMARHAIILFIVQLAVNALWSWLFFAWKNGALALFGATALGLLVAATLLAFARLRAYLAATLLAPYLAWVGFAVVLTWAVWLRNPGLL